MPKKNNTRPDEIIVSCGRYSYILRAAVMEAAILANPDIKYSGKRGIIDLLHNNIGREGTGKGSGFPAAYDKVAELLGNEAAKNRLPFNSRGNRLQELEKGKGAAKGLSVLISGLFQLNDVATKILYAAEERSMGKKKKPDISSFKAEKPKQKPSLYSGLVAPEIGDVVKPKGRGR